MKSSSQSPWTAISRTPPISRQQLTAPLDLLVMYPRVESHGKHRLILYRITLVVFTDPLPTNRRPVVARVGRHGEVMTD
jgi:hypothetical protein